jgi:hypothetical protein
VGGAVKAVRTDREGVALLIVLMLTLVVAAIAAGAALIGANTFLINEFDQKTSLLETVADAGLELGRARLNANPRLYSDSSVSTLELEAAVYHADGTVIPGVRRTVYSIPLGGGLGEYGNFAALVAIAEDANGVRAIRRLNLVQESFAVYAYFTDFEPSYIAFSNGDQLYGPVHSNSNIKIRPTGATFHGPVTTAGVFEGAGDATFLDDTATHVTRVPMPTTSQITRLRPRATPGHMVFTSAPGGHGGQATLRIQFLSRDVDGDGVNEGFIRAYRSPDPDWVTATVKDTLVNSPNCGHQEAYGRFYSTLEDPNSNHTPERVLTDNRRHCYLGGADEIHATADEKDGQFIAVDSLGAWDRYPGSVHPLVAGEADADYLFPIDRRLNPAFRGVIFVDGKVVVSGTVRGRLTVAATGNIIIGDDLVYDTDPGSGTCQDMLGLFSGGQVVVADNTLNSPQVAPDSLYYTYDETPDEYIHASILALDQFTVDNVAYGSTTAEPCNGVPWGRGCLHITGGLVQQTRGLVGYTFGTGYIKRYTYDTCAFGAPPPYFPSTGHFWRGRYYEVDPIGFEIADYFDAMNGRPPDPESSDDESVEEHDD